MPIVRGGVATRLSSTRFIRTDWHPATSVRRRPCGSNLLRSADISLVVRMLFHDYNLTGFLLVIFDA